MQAAQVDLYSNTDQLAIADYSDFDVEIALKTFVKLY
jgi:hypothetical protein